MRYKLLIAYDGTHYSGWQVQKGQTSIQALIQAALQTALRHPLDLTGSGRTDAGVHALGQTAHFDTEEFFEHALLRASLNALLPADIRIKDIVPVAPDFHARYSAKSKIYHYHLHLDHVLDPFQRLYRYQFRAKLDLDLLKKAALLFLGTHDFTSFANEKASKTASHDPIRTITRLDVIEEKGGIRLEFEGDGFLYKMVRNITGTLLDAATKKISLDAIPKIFEAKDRRTAGSAAPPQGLFLVEVLY
jgi:tRNA pseudouridine38-40 synthase